MFYVGQELEWTSQASGRTIPKRGKIVQVVGAGQKPNSEYRSLYRNRGVQTVAAREETSYVVEVVGKRGGKKHYWPRVSAVTVVNQAGVI